MQEEKEENMDRIWQIWIDEKGKMAYFHPLEGCRLVEFRTRLTYAVYINNLIDESYHFS